MNLNHRAARHFAWPLSLIALVLVILALTAGSASASDPIAGCASEAGYFLQDANAFPLTMAVDSAGNQDGWVCVKFLSTPETAAVGLLVIDNRVAR
jgi:hypothetical protein